MTPRGGRKASKGSTKKAARKRAPARSSKQAAPAAPLLLSLQQFAATIGVHSREVESLVTQGCPRERDGRTWKYPLVAITWHISRQSPLLTKQQFATAIGLKLRQIDNLAAEGCPRERDGRAWKYPLEAVSWYIDRTFRQRANGNGQADSRARREEYEADMARIKLERMRGRLMTTDQFAERLADAYGRVRAQLENLGPRLAPDVAGRTPVEAVELIDAAVRDVVEEMHRAEDIPDDA